MNRSESPLGKPVAYSGTYQPDLLYAIARQHGRDELGISNTLPFVGSDIWNAWELSWLNQRGKPHVAVASFGFDCCSPNIIESKSFKLYLNSFAQTQCHSPQSMLEILQRDVSACAGSHVSVGLQDAGQLAGLRIQPLQGQSLDSQEIDIDSQCRPQAQLLSCDRQQTVEETLTTDLFKSNCPVTGQPDWASVQIHYKGPGIGHAGLLRYLLSFREHTGFHEQCVERIYTDVLHQCGPLRLDVYARFTRRGGLDINPWRSSHEKAPPGNPRSVRQ